MTPTTRDRISDERLKEISDYPETVRYPLEMLVDLARECLAHRAAEAQRPTWQPIAEHNGTRFVMLVGWTHSRDVQRGFFDSGIGGGMWRSADRKGHPLFDPQPTHRMPLPAPPDGGKS